MLGDLQRFRIKYNQGSRFLSHMLNLHSTLESNKNSLGVMDFWSVWIFETLLIQAVVRWDLLLRDERVLQRSVREARAGDHVTSILPETRAVKGLKKGQVKYSEQVLVLWKVSVQMAPDG